jgi:hypothetical protein
VQAGRKRSTDTSDIFVRDLVSLPTIFRRLTGSARGVDLRPGALEAWIQVRLWRGHAELFKDQGLAAAVLSGVHNPGYGPLKRFDDIIAAIARG